MKRNMGIKHSTTSDEAHRKRLESLNDIMSDNSIWNDSVSPSNLPRVTPLASITLKTERQNVAKNIDPAPALEKTFRTDKSFACSELTEEDSGKKRQPTTRIQFTPPAAASHTTVRRATKLFPMREESLAERQDLICLLNRQRSAQENLYQPLASNVLGWKHECEIQYQQKMLPQETPYNAPQQVRSESSFSFDSSELFDSSESLDSMGKQHFNPALYRESKPISRKMEQLDEYPEAGSARKGHVAAKRSHKNEIDVEANMIPLQDDTQDNIQNEDLRKNGVDKIRDICRLLISYLGRLFFMYEYIFARTLPSKFHGIDLFRTYRAISVIITTATFSVKIIEILYFYTRNLMPVVFFTFYGSWVSLNALLPYVILRDRARRMLFKMFSFRMKYVKPETAEWVITLVGLCIGGAACGSYQIVRNGNVFFVTLSNIFSLVLLMYKICHIFVEFFILTDINALQLMEPNRMNLILMQKFDRMKLKQKKPSTAEISDLRVNMDNVITRPRSGRLTALSPDIYKSEHAESHTGRMKSTVPKFDQNKYRPKNYSESQSDKWDDDVDFPQTSSFGAPIRVKLSLLEKHIFINSR